MVMKPRGELLFRTPTPFALGGYAETQPRPSEFSVAGMLRSAIMDLSEEKDIPKDVLEEILGKAKGYTTYDFCWKLVGPYFLKGDSEVFYPIPLDVFVIEEEGARIRLADWLIPQLEEVNGEFRELLAPSAFKGESARKRYWLVSSKFMKKYLDGERGFDEKEAVRGGDVYRLKTHPHVKLSRETKTVEVVGGEGMYFAVERLVLRDGWSFIAGVQLDNCGKPDKVKEVFLNLNGTIARLGGEGGLVELEVREAKSLLEAEAGGNVGDGGRVRLVLTSSAVFGDGSRSSFLPNLSGVKGCACARVAVGGWDYVANKPKELRFGVAPGSVYYLEGVQPSITLSRVHVHPDYRNVLGSCLIAKGWL
ncbi:MAG: type III-B CRISPR module-associated Cmr3 family protein [Candidatus Jordarchaeales archaeon]